MKKFILGKIKKKSIELIVSGGAIGADKLAEEFSEEFDIPKKIFKPEWEKYGKSAGFIRNKKIVEASDIIFAFWDGISKGTKSTINLARESDKLVHVHIF